MGLILSDGSYNIGNIAKASGEAFASRRSGNLNRIKQLNYERTGGRGFKPVVNKTRIGLSPQGRNALQQARAGALDLAFSLASGGDNLLLASTQRAISLGESLSADQSRNSSVGNLADNLTSIEPGSVVDEQA